MKGFPEHVLYCSGSLVRVEMITHVIKIYFMP
jgi:hypothetical protein